VWTSSLRAFPASLFLLPGEVLVKKTNDGSGQRFSEPFALWNPDIYSWKMYELSLGGESEEFSETWPTSGMIFDGVAYELPTSEHLTSARDGSHLLPTPNAGNFNSGESLESWEARRQRNLAKGINGNGQGTSLAIAVQLLPTPSARDGKSVSRAGERGRSSARAPLPEVVHLLPTPNARDGKGIPSDGGHLRSLPRSIGALMREPSADGS
jgi:hypothetical protein